MPPDSRSDTVVTALTHAPAMAHGLVRDLRVRWALEEIGWPYRTEIFDAMTPRPDEYRQWQPFGQVPAFADGDLQVFESGAILLYLGEKDERLLPREPALRWRAISWAIAALNSVDPAIMPLLFTNVIHADKPWADEARPVFVGFVEQRLTRVAEALGQNEWLAGPFSIADILMVTVLRQLDRPGLLAGFPTISAHKARAEARAPFQRALADQLAALGEPAVLEPLS